MDTLELGSHLDDYLIVDVLGQGGFGVTYQALDPSLQRHLAIKEYFPEQFAQRRDGIVVAGDGEENQRMFQWGLERFLSEARTLARFQHPNVVEVTRYFEANGTAYLAMKFEEGKDLDKWLTERKEPLSETEITAFILPILDGLQAIHEQGLIHRDVKPQNIMIRNDGTPVLIDFGSARPSSRADNSALTAVISPGYSPPEQYGIDDSSLQGPATDIYAIAGVIYRMISGSGPPDALLRIAGKKMAPAASVSARELNPQLLRAVDAGLALDASSRPQTALEYRNLLTGQAPNKAAKVQPAKDDDATFVRPMPGSPPGTDRSSGRTRGVLATLAVAMAVAVAVAVAAFGYLGLGWWQETETPAEPNAANAPPALDPQVSVAPRLFALTLELNPDDAKVEFTGAKNADNEDLRFDQAYRPGMMLSAGRYQVEASLAGYVTSREWLDHGPQSSEHAITLAPVPVPVPAPAAEVPRYALTLDLSPRDATVDLVGFARQYQPGLKLEPGSYRLRVSKGGYETSEQTFRMPERRQTVVVTLRPMPGAQFKDPLTSASGQVLNRPGPTMVVIPSGTFKMGDLAGVGLADENPVHRVSIGRAFALSKYEVTFADYAEFARSTGTEPPPNRSGQGNRPVINVNWDKASEYASWLSARTGERYRLPTEAEWEYGARAGSTTRYPWGEKIDCDKAHIKSCGNEWGNGLAPVGSFAPNQFGLHDMHGNVQEMTQDCYQRSYSGVRADGGAWEREDGFYCDVRVTRGGSMNSRATQLRSARRGNVDPRRNPYTDLGFRVARSFSESIR